MMIFAVFSPVKWKGGHVGITMHKIVPFTYCIDGCTQSATEHLEYLRTEIGFTQLHFNSIYAQGRVIDAQIGDR